MNARVRKEKKTAKAIIDIEKIRQGWIEVIMLDKMPAIWEGLKYRSGLKKEERWRAVG